MMRKKYWEDMSRAGRLGQALWNARKCMPLLDKYSGYTGAEYKQQLTTKAKVISTLWGYIGFFSKEFCSSIVGFLGDGREGWWHPQLSKKDLHFIFMRPMLESEEEVMSIVVISSRANEEVDTEDLI